MSKQSKQRSTYAKEQLRYSYAYVMAAGLTFFAFSLASGSLVTGTWLAALLLGAAATQLYVQSRYFLHLDDKKETPRWRLASYAFTWLTLLIVVVGSLWIMVNLNYNMMMDSSEMTDYMLEQNGKGF